jgi:hypothetical protein
MQEQQVTKKFSDLGIKVENKKFVGEKTRLAKVLNTEIIVHGYCIKPSKFPEKGSDKCLWLQISVDGKKYVAFSIAKILMETLQRIPDDSFPFTTKIVNNNDSYEFT